MTKAIVDLNVFITSLISKTTTSAAIVNAWRAEQFTLVFSQELHTELRSVLARPKFRRYFSPANAQQLAAVILKHAEFVVPVTKLSLCRDPKDNILLDVAIAGQAQYLVTGDKDLLDDAELRATMNDKYGVRVVTIAEFLEALGQL